MKFSLLLFALYHILRVAAITNSVFKKYISKAQARVLIKTKDGRYARLFIFDRGKIRSIAGDRKDFDVALIWADADTGFAVMTDKRSDASFNAAAEGKLKVEGMGIYAQWFEDAVKLVM